VNHAEPRVAVMSAWQFQRSPFASFGCLLEGQAQPTLLLSTVTFRGPLPFSNQVQTGRHVFLATSLSTIMLHLVDAGKLAKKEQPRHIVLSSNHWAFLHNLLQLNCALFRSQFVDSTQKTVQCFLLLCDAEETGKSIDSHRWDHVWCQCQKDVSSWQNIEKVVCDCWRHCHSFEVDSFQILGAFFPTKEQQERNVMFVRHGFT
jgi:hypothetical protein